MSNSEDGGMLNPLDLSTPVVIEVLSKDDPLPLSVNTEDIIAQMTADISKGGSAPAFKPKRTELNVWDIIQEYAGAGGILDLSEDVGESAALIHVLHASMKGDKGNSLGLSGKEVMDLLLKATAQRAKIKQTHQEMQIKRREVLTLDKFHAFLNQLLRILSEYIPDPQEFKQMGQQIAELCHILEDE